MLYDLFQEPSATATDYEAFVEKFKTKKEEWKQKESQSLNSKRIPGR